MEKRPPITVVIPVLKINEDLFFSLRSICESHYSNFQIVLILSKECKGNVENLREYLILPFIFYEFELEPGLYQAMNQGWRASKDSLICFLGVGDFFISPDSLDLVANYFEVNDLNSEHWGYGPWFFMDSKNNLKFAALDQNFQTSDLLSTTTPICHQTVFMTKQLLTKLDGFNTDYEVSLIQGHLELETLRNSQSPNQKYFPAIQSIIRFARFRRDRKFKGIKPYSWISSDIIGFYAN
jgi:glycosyltransferase involved in cell wall biosynthesis